MHSGDTYVVSIYKCIYAEQLLQVVVYTAYLEHRWFKSNCIALSSAEHLYTATVTLPLWPAAVQYIQVHTTVAVIHQPTV
jgi:hypothetical protein